MLHIMSNCPHWFANRRKPTQRLLYDGGETVTVSNIEHGTSTNVRLGALGLEQVRRLKAELCPKGPICPCRRELPVDDVGGVRAVHVKFECFRLWWIVRS